MNNILRDLKHVLTNIYEIFIRRKKIAADTLDYTFVLMLSADYDNLGDVAITYAQIKYLEQNFPNYKIVEVPVKDTCKVFLDLKKKMSKSTVIVLVGGGNTGDKYELMERLRRFIIRKFGKQKIFSFPQTIDFSDTPLGRHSLKKSVKDYSKSPNYTICARETVSEKIFKERFNNNVILAPDIVLSLSYDFGYKRDGVMSLFRNDKELNMEDNFKRQLVKNLREKYNYLASDTRAKDFKVERKYDILLSLLKQISSKKVVVTDRLHGMIFCYITKTPCVVFRNNNHKINQTYEDWIKGCNYIILEKDDDIEKVCEDVDVLYNLDTTIESDKLSLDKYNDFKHNICNMLNRKNA